MTVFADTSYWIALTDIGDAAHESAVMLSASLGGRAVITTESVLTEYLNFFAGWGERLRVAALANVQTMLAGPAVRVLPHTEEAFQDGLKLYAARPDKGYSLTDCISMETMRRERLSDVLTRDRDFEQEGFRALLRQQ